MRLGAVFCCALVCLPSWSQDNTIHLNVPLVVLQAEVTDERGHSVPGLAVEDFIVLDNGQSRPVHLDTSDDGLAPVSLAVAIQSSDISAAVLAKIRKVGSTVSEAVVGHNAEAAVLSFDSKVRVIQDFTKDPNAISAAFESFEPGDGGSRMVDAVSECLRMLAGRPNGRRSDILVIGESRDRGSKTKLSELIQRLQHSSTTVYSLVYSAYLTPFTAKQDELQPGDFNPLLFITEPARMAKANTARSLTQATGGRSLGFERKSGLEDDLIRVGNEIHNRYVLSFSAPDSEPRASFHRIEVSVKGRPDLRVRVRPGYWSGPAEAKP